MNLVSSGLSERLSKIKRLSERPWFYPAALLVVGLVAYGYSLPSLGFYWDDWEVVFLLNAKSPALLYGYFAFDRPFAWPYQLMYAAFGLNAVAWHVVTLLLRWGGILFLYFSLRMIWSRYESYLRWLGALLLVFPGFLQQSISAAYNRHFMAFALFGLSMYLMSLAVRRPRKGWFLWPLSWITALIQVFTIEYFVGLELIRVPLLWLLLRQDGVSAPAKTARRTAVLALPYVLLVGFYGWWRLRIFPSTIPTANYAGDVKLLQDFNPSFALGVLAVLTRAVFDLVYATTQVWLAALSGPAAFTFQSKIAWFAFAAGLLIAALFGFFHDLHKSNGSKAGRSASLGALFILGLGAFLVSALPIWLTSKDLSGGGRWDDRFSLAAMLGAGLMTLTLIMRFVRARWQKTLLCVLLTIAVTTQILTVNRYRLEWSEQNAYYWQLAWRVPSLMPQTAVFSLEQPSASVPGYDTSFAMNVLFGATILDGKVPYWFFTNDRFLNFDFVPDKPISYTDRNLKFSGNTSDAIAIVHQGEDRCLQVLDGAYAAEPFYGQDQAQLVGVSNVSRILPDLKPGMPDPDIFGNEPPHTWCYYFEKADLARQMSDWKSILMLETQAAAKGLSAKFGPELIPFVEANAQTGNWQKALELSRTARPTVAKMEPVLCATWASLSTLPAADLLTVRQAQQEFACTSP